MEQQPVDIGPVTLPRTVAEAIVDHARAGKPEEVCGVVRGRGLTALEAIRSRNVAEERIENYTVDPQTLLKQFDFEEEGDEMMGIYHSHPVSAAYPSATDAWNAHYPDAIYFICSLENDASPVIRAFRLATHFPQIDLASLRAVLDFHETRPGLFASYVDPQQSPHSILAQWADDGIEPPFYVVYHAGHGSETGVDVRVVTIAERVVAVHE